MTSTGERELDRAIRQYQLDHPGTSLSAARRAIERRVAESAPMPRRLAIVPVPHDGESLASWVDRVAADNLVGRHQMMELLGLEPGSSAARRLRQLSEHLPERTAERLYAATGIKAEQARAMAAIPPSAKAVEVLPFDEVVEHLGRQLEQARTQAQTEGLPASAPWTLAFREPQITQMGGAQTLRKAAKRAARPLRISLRVTVYRREGDSDQLVTAHNQGPYKVVKRDPVDTATAVPFTLDAHAGPSGDECDCGRGYCLSGSLARFGWSPWPEPVWYSIRPDTDLRTLPEEYRTDDGMHLLFAPLERRSLDDYDHVLDLTPFLEGAELGPLADVQVYATNARGQYRGSSHGAMCRYADTREGAGFGPLPSQRHEILTLAELVEILRPMAENNSFTMPLEQMLAGGLAKCDQDLEGRWCVYCSGYSVRLLTPLQCSHYRSERERRLQSPVWDSGDPGTDAFPGAPVAD
ncbi:TniQ family protein [Streptomyces aurantiogriseus]|uniref:TniQ domain-containing protein n=1 Tax=Streptomyces aurantiogriseus TaxID=66870 RepID=A0A918L0C0_9ACTN|nr:TniQ family protein [Streptomyces aurantiogriseus]GGR64108.1 hypothetical protein GCM10010251_95920 [Streptomyces aurantiogriseus]